jgi:hypothetical protein
MALTEAQEELALFAAKEWVAANVHGAGVDRFPAVFGARAAQVYLGALKVLRQGCTGEELIAELAAQPVLCEMQRGPAPSELHSGCDCRGSSQERPADSEGAA